LAKKSRRPRQRGPDTIVILLYYSGDAFGKKRCPDVLGRYFCAQPIKGRAGATLAILGYRALMAETRKLAAILASFI